jgi:hypothetical protein
VEHYVIPVLYPAGLTRELQLALAVLVIVVNLAVYCWVLWQHRKRAGQPR